ncbi:transporter substrate-binding domain-containing protein [Pseudodesulfovibrio indicus]|jgi:ABC-type amino acid transport substrate-binding protein|uniref:ABC transporter substrate-binding protein n=1 Tax=Pseudodesulfovibrio indicus TaxID=1716143 RepID=A0A126QQK9_9BACT|nr:transporter substrate-binding domain-containing protein [Pseudodesulfovibrio indicus]AMK12089.1 ABC transporter substrate-binding protein [Pseudodesulfovibrio indicus]TDT88689.1 amino acid ABC transporter substrate-binding protein (PAAT family) [Pseudodesulfovibrio indicus]
MAGKKMRNMLRVLVVLCLALFLVPGRAAAGDLADVRKAGVLRHIGIPYANFIIDENTGLDVEIMRLFARHLGVEYRFVESDWSSLFGDLTGKVTKVVGDEVQVVGSTEVKGDIIATGLTELDWRKQLVNYSAPTFPTQVWCIAGSYFPARPIRSAGAIEEDIKAVKEILRGRRVMGKEGTCLAPGLYGIENVAKEIFSFPGSLNDIAPAIIKGEADMALLDVPDTLVALEKWPGKLKVLGPVSEQQQMGAGFAKDAPELLRAFNEFYAGLRASGEYDQLVQKYYPSVFRFYPEFFGQ